MVQKKSDFSSDFTHAMDVSAAPFGTFAPNAWQGFVISFTRCCGTSWLSKRLSFLLRRLAFVRKGAFLDLEIDDVSFRLHHSGNLCDKRLMFTPQYFDAQERDFLMGDIDAAERPYIFLDIGANIGAYALFVAERAGAGARVFAFEPQRDIFARLCTNIALNPQFSSVKAEALAISDRNGEMTLFIDQDNSGESSLKMVRESRGEQHSTTVPSVTLLHYLQSEDLPYVSAMKLDVEGAEDLILLPFFKDAPDVLLPRVLILERAHARWQQDILSAAQARGFHLEKRTRLNAILVRKEDSDG